MTTEILPGIYRLQLSLSGSYLKYINVYLVEGDSGCLLVDTGWNTDATLDSLKRQLAEIDINLKEINQIVITHIHLDHCGLAGRLKQLSGAKIAQHHLQKKYFEQRYFNMDTLLAQMKQWLHINGVPADELPNLQTTSVGAARLVAPASPDITFRGGETIPFGSFNFKVIWTPGHSPGHICLYEPTQKILFSGDHVLPTITSNIGLHPQSTSNPLGDFLNSLNIVNELEVNLVLPGHENPITDLQKRVDELLLHHEQRKAAILEILTPEPKTAYRISMEMTWLLDATVNGVKGCDLGLWDKRLALLETLSHLELSRIDGKVNKFTRDSIVFYQNIGETPQAS